MKQTHTNLLIQQSGLWINPKYPFIGASPDGLVSCDCCGEGVVEIKCPYCAKGKKLSEAKLNYLSEGKLKENHRYFYQVQTQLIVTEREFCDFVVWSEQDIDVIRIELNENTETEIITKSKEFFIQVILPEITGSLITRNLSSRKQASEKKTLFNNENLSTTAVSSDIDQRPPLQNIPSTSKDVIQTKKPKSNDSVIIQDKRKCLCNVECLEANFAACCSENCPY
ncbi:uncharacterized protein LOC132748587 [Ruditapes philippinarum]|uniref:uncharacterized protein LOC132748587 n=1 Tax=Ruditapes philippinarum TaxID=129788 RepID=UPI00295BF76D|nr:uncharacterized protein LOC132748587 [Ruditapes philippinarum]